MSMLVSDSNECEPVHRAACQCGKAARQTTFAAGAGRGGSCCRPHLLARANSEVHFERPRVSFANNCTPSPPLVETNRRWASVALAFR